MRCHPDASDRNRPYTTTRLMAERERSLSISDPNVTSNKTLHTTADLLGAEVQEVKMQPLKGEMTLGDLQLKPASPAETARSPGRSHAPRDSLLKIL